MFASEVDHDKYPHVKQKYRFEEVKIESEKLDMLRKHIQDHNKFINYKAREIILEDNGIEKIDSDAKILIKNNC